MKRYGTYYRVPDDVENTDAWANFWTRVSLLAYIVLFLFVLAKAGSCASHYFSERIGQAIGAQR